MKNVKQVRHSRASRALESWGEEIGTRCQLGNNIFHAKKKSERFSLFFLSDVNIANWMTVTERKRINKNDFSIEQFSIQAKNEINDFPVLSIDIPKCRLNGRIWKKNSDSVDPWEGVHISPDTIPKFHINFGVESRRGYLHSPTSPVPHQFWSRFAGVIHTPSSSFHRNAPDVIPCHCGHFTLVHVRS